MKHQVEIIKSNTFFINFQDDKKKTTTISNSVVMGDVRISVGCKLNNCIVGSGATIGDQVRDEESMSDSVL